MMTKVNKKAFEQELAAVIKKHVNFENMTQLDARWEITPQSVGDFKKLNFTFTVHFELLTDKKGKFEARGIGG